MGQIKNIKLHIVTDIKISNMSSRSSSDEEGYPRGAKKRHPPPITKADVEENPSSTKPKTLKPVKRYTDVAKGKSQIPKAQNGTKPKTTPGPIVKPSNDTEKLEDSSNNHSVKWEPNEHDTVF